MSVVDNGLSIGAIPAVYFHTPAATTQSPEMTWANLIIHSLLFLLRSGSVKSKTNTVCMLIYLSYSTFSWTILLITVIKLTQLPKRNVTTEMPPKFMKESSASMHSRGLI